MRYISTRGGMEPSGFLDIVLKGMAPDRGLIYPENITRSFFHYSCDDLDSVKGLSYQDLALEIISRFADDMPIQDLEAIIKKTYTKEKFGSDEITPLAEIGGGLYKLDLSNGPTLAFKDIALQFLGNLFEYILDRNDDHLNILGATSGDTGSSAEYAVMGKRNISIFMLTPKGRMSDFQAAQMYSLMDKNVHNISFNGVFDDCQDLVKEVNRDEAFRKKFRIGAVNSINWARIAAQTVYYFKGYLAAAGNGQMADFSVPTGNFGNLLAGYVAKQMGLPVRRLILATNENNVLDEFFRTGVYRSRTRGEIAMTSSPSMDISKASNLERFLYGLFGRDPDITRSYMEQFESSGCIDLSRTEYFRRLPAMGIVSGTSTHQDRLNMIREVYKESGLIIDPHTADGVKVGLDHKEDGVPLICLETAKPAKFNDTIREALGFIPPRPIEYEGIEQKEQRFAELENDAEKLKEYIRENSLSR